MAFNFTLPLRIAQAILAILVLALTAYVADWWNSFWHAYSPSQINFLLFTSIWTLLTLAYLILAPWRFPTLAHKFAVLAAEALVMLFWFAGFIALAVFLSDRVCYGHVCRAAQATTVFGAISWALFAATTALAAIHVFRTRGSASPEPHPSMNQVHPTT